MAEVQDHGKSFEDLIIRQRTGLSKDDYDKLKKNGYTSEFDLCKELIVNYDGSIKTTGSNTICCADLLRMMNHREDYRLIVGCYEQIQSEKVFHTQYEFFIESKHYELLWDGMNYEDVVEYVNKVKSVQNGKQAQQEYQLVAESWKSNVQSNSSLFIVNPKVDSKKQRRVQCSVHLDKLLVTGIKYHKTEIDFVIHSKRRNKK